MSLQIVQQDVYEGNDWWRWSVWLEGEVSELDAIERVTYYLHPTFPQPIRNVDDRSTSFRLDASGWGEFRIEAEVHRRAGGRLFLEHDLTLRRPASEPRRRGATRRAVPSDTLEAIPGPAGPRVFVSYAASDAGTANELRSALERRGVQVADASSSLSEGDDWHGTIRRAIAGSDALIVLTSGTPSPAQGRELGIAQSRAIPIVPIVLGDAEVPEVASSVAALRLSPKPTRTEIDERVSSALPAFFDKDRA